MALTAAWFAARSHAVSCPVSLALKVKWTFHTVIPLTIRITDYSHLRWTVRGQE